MMAVLMALMAAMAMSAFAVDTEMDMPYGKSTATGTAGDCKITVPLYSATDKVAVTVKQGPVTTLLSATYSAVPDGNGGWKADILFSASAGVWVIETETEQGPIPDRIDRRQLTLTLSN